MNPYLTYEKNAISSAYPWLIGLYIDNPVLETAGYSRVVADTSEFAWIDENDTDVSFTVFPFTIPGITLSASSALPSISIRAFNTATVAKLVEDNNGFISSNITIYFLNVKAIRSDDSSTSTNFYYNMGNYPLQYSFVINNVKIGNYITFELGAPNYLTNLIPSKRYYRDFCDVEYQSEYCWMNGKTANPETNFCDKTYTNCIAHWNEQSGPTKGIQFPGFPNLAKGSYVYY